MNDKELIERLRAPRVSHHKMSEEGEEYETVRWETPAPPINHEAASRLEALVAERDAAHQMWDVADADRVKLSKELARAQSEIEGLRKKVEQMQPHYDAHMGICCMAVTTAVYPELYRLREQVKEIEGLRRAAMDASHALEPCRVWGGMDWNWHPPQAKRAWEILRAAIAGAQP